MLNVALATAVFGLVHSALSSRTAKRSATRMIGERNRNGLYRIMFNGQAVVCCVLLYAYIRKQPNRELYRIRGTLAWGMHAGQAATLLYAVAATQQVGITRFLGLKSFATWLGNGPVEPAPEGQGPALDGRTIITSGCPFARSRHPLNFVPVPLLWLWPRMTTNLFAFNVVTLFYLLLGCLHEEKRLLEAYGQRYRDYRASGVPFYIPTFQAKRIGFDEPSP